MTKAKKKYFIGFALIIAALIFFVLGSFKDSMQYYLTVDELLDATELVQDQEFRLSGKVVQGSIQKPHPDQPRYEFDITAGGKSVHVRYQGLAPDTFNDSSSVVVTGRFDATKRVFEAHHLLAKCASKYEAKLQ